MSLSIGIVGLPNAGKSTLFNALVKGHQAKVADYPFTTIEPNVGIVEVPDERLDKIAAILKLPKKIPATIKFIDIAGLVKNAHKGEGLGNQFLGHIREVDTIVHVLDGFSKDSSPDEAKEIVNLELELADIKKPTLYVLNVAEKKLHEPLEKDTIYISAKIEEELTDLSDKDALDYLKTYGLAQSGLVRLIQESYKLLNLITFYTLIPRKQVQAWSTLNGTTAPQAAGKVHTDMERGFIAADIVHYTDFISSGGSDASVGAPTSKDRRSWQEAREKGKLRTEGKDYIIKDGDIMHFKFNV